MYYEDVFLKLNKSKVKYLVTGGVALNLHGIPRMTADLDLMVDLRKDNLVKLVKALDKLGFKPRAPVKLIDFISEEKRMFWLRNKHMVMFLLYHPKEAYQEVDIFNKNPIIFREAFKERKVVPAGNIKIPLISTGHLIQLKRKSKRKQDLADVESLKTLKKIMRKNK
jgi:hypothetical protein